MRLPTARTSLAAIGLCLVAACKDSTGTQPGSMQLRVNNSTAGAVTVKVGAADFGSIAAGATSVYREIGEGNLVVRINGASTGTEDFCDGCLSFAGTTRWTAVVDSTHMVGFAIDLSRRAR